MLSYSARAVRELSTLKGAVLRDTAPAIIIKPTKGKPAGVFGGLGRGGDITKGSLPLQQIPFLHLESREFFSS